MAFAMGAQTAHSLVEGRYFVWPSGSGLELTILRHPIPGHEHAVLEKLAEVAPEVLHGADSLKTMHSFMAVLALVLDDATFARVLLALNDGHPNACARTPRSMHCMHTVRALYAHCIHPGCTGARAS